MSPKAVPLENKIVNANVALRSLNKIFRSLLLLAILNTVIMTLTDASDSNTTKALHIYISKDGDDIKQFASEELRKHLYLVTGTLPEIRKSSDTVDPTAISFFIGTKPPYGEMKRLKPEESNYVIKNQSVYLYGDDKIEKQSSDRKKTVINKYNRTGTLFAVYDFLYNELGVRWIEPGDKGIIYKKQVLTGLSDRFYSWTPKYSFREFRMTPWKWTYLTGKKIKMHKSISKIFQYTEEEVKKRYKEEGIWLRRMKLGMHHKPNYGHAFTKYWEMYGDKHPEWFAMDRFGFRGVTIFNRIDPSRVKFCVSNKELQKEIVKNWHLEMRKDHYYNACINDSRGYCTCTKCRALDAIEDKGSMTDRYVYFWNALLEGIKKYDKDARLIVYAYSDYRHRPIRRNISSDITVGLVPNYTDSLHVIKSNLEGWKAAGLKEYFLRPNDFTHYMGFPAGNEKYIIDRYKIFEGNKILGIDYERNYVLSNWDINGIGQYILARKISSGKSFFELEDEYLNTFGNAKEEIAVYYLYWRKLFEKKHLKYIKSGKKYSKKEIYANLSLFYSEDDFIYAAKVLDSALLKACDVRTIDRIKHMQLANEHARLIFNAIVNKNKKSSCELYDFRKIHQKQLSLSLPILLYFENHYKITGIKKYCQ